MTAHQSSDQRRGRTICSAVLSTRRRGRALTTVVAVIALALAALSQSCTAQADRPQGRELRVVASIAPIAEIVKRVAGESASVEGLVPPGVDSHTFEPSPGTARALARADLVFLNGLALDDQLANLARSTLKKSGEVVFLGEKTITPEAYAYDFAFPQNAGRPNPHVWMNPALALSYAAIARDVLSARSPANAATYGDNFAQFANEIGRLDGAIFEAVRSIPAENQKLLTYHDSFAYFAPRYGLKVIGAVQPSSFREPSPREVAAVIEQVRRERVPAVFGSEVFPSPVLEQIAREGGARYIDTLRDDELPGESGSPEHSYLGMIREDASAIVAALGGDASSILLTGRSTR